MEQYPQRGRNRLPGYDYSGNGAYFVTICTAEGRNCFWPAGAATGRPSGCLSPCGEIVKRYIESIGEAYDGVVQVDNYVIMPNHVHLLLSLHPERLGGRRVAAPTVSTVVNQFKGRVSREAGASLWQKSFHDHVVRDQADYLRIWEYIDGNPGKWAEDRYYIDASRADYGDNDKAWPPRE